MDDKLEQTIELYSFHVKSRYRARGAVILDTDGGLVLLRRHSRVGEHFLFENRLKELLAQKGMPLTDRAVPNSGGKLVTEWESGEKYVAYQWYAGNECDYRNRQMLCQAAGNLGKIHTALKQASGQPVPVNENLLQRFHRRGRELKRVYAYMKKKKRKSDFELYALGCFNDFEKKAARAEERLEKSSYFRANGNASAAVCHGEYNYHNLIMTEDGIATTNFERAAYEMQLMDLAYFLRKTMEKNNWDAEKGSAVLTSYQAAAGLPADAAEFLFIVLSYPEKFWKLMNHYMNRKKTWLSDKNMEKLRAVREQEEKKQEFLETLR